jgi:hypothetical protein
VPLGSLRSRPIPKPAWARMAPHGPRMGPYWPAWAPHGPAARMGSAWALCPDGPWLAWARGWARTKNQKKKKTKKTQTRAAGLLECVSAERKWFICALYYLPVLISISYRVCWHTHCYDRLSWCCCFCFGVRRIGSSVLPLLLLLVLLLLLLPGVDSCCDVLA